MENFGLYLKSQREKKGVRLEEIASITKIHLHSLNLLEASRWEELPPEPFIRGFILAYAKYIGLDLKEVLAKYAEEVGQGHAAEENADDAKPASEPVSAKHESPNDLIAQAKPAIPRQILIGVAALAVVIVMAAFIYIGKKSRGTSADVAEAPSNEVVASATGTAAPSPTPAQTASAPVTPTIPSENKVVATAPEVKAVPPIAPPAVTPAEKTAERAPAQQTPPPPPATAPAPQEKSEGTAKTEKPVVPPGMDDPHRVTIEGKERTWIKVVVDNAAPVEYFLPKGDSALYTAKQKIKIVLGNSTGAVVTHNGTAASGTKFQGTIRSYIFPPNAKFPQDVPPKRAAASTPEPAKTDDGDETASDAAPSATGD